MKKIIFLFIVSVLLVNCGGSGGDEPVTPPTTPPGAFSGTSPENNKVCTTGSIISSDQSKLSIPLVWTRSSDADDYLVQVYQNSTKVYEQATNALTVNVSLEKGKTYTWLVTARNSDGTKSTSTYSFTVEGIAVSNYAPYAAVISLSVTTNNTLAVTWTGSDEDHATSELQYQVNVYENNNLVINSGIITANSFTTTDSVLSETTYKVGVTTIDPDGAKTTSYQYLVTD